MQVEGDPNQLRYTANLFSNGANELRQKAKRLEDIQIGLVQGQNSWKGEGAQGFSSTMEKIQNEIQQKAGILEEAAQILIRFAYQMDNVNQIRNQASNLERTLWSISGDSEDAFQERQSISFQVNQLLQEAEWQANAADVQATSAINSLSIPMPDLNLGNVISKPPANEPWYDHVIDWFKEQGHEFVAAYEKHWTTGNIWYDELNYWTLGIPDKVEKVFHTKPFSLENLEANLDLFISVVPVTKAESVALDGVKVASNVTEEKMTEQEAINDTVDSNTQGATSTERSDTSNGTEKAKFTYKNNPMENPKAAKDIVEDSDAVYGYSPNPNSTRIGKFANKIDWTDPKQVEIARTTRLAYHKNNEQMLETLYNQGYSTEDIARKMVNERNANRLNSYLERGDIEGYEMARKSNLATYQNVDGPTPESMFEKYGSWQGVIDASVRSNPGMDACVGLYDEYHGGKQR